MHFNSKPSFSAVGKKSLSERFTQLKSFVKDKDVVGKMGINDEGQDNFVPLTKLKFVSFVKFWLFYC